MRGRIKQKRGTIAIPIAPVFPNTKEKEVLISFIKRKYPSLWDNSPEMVELSIQSRLNTHSDLVNLVKKSTVIRRKNKLAEYKQR